ncbi:MAG: hypothetical protein TYPL_0210 [Candidatus Tyloplasma litorale]|nr:MAG: hypothetical protein TYPL_0210 [Mycoplasmatales bacterium]
MIILKRGISIVFVVHRDLTSKLSYLNKIIKRIPKNIPFILIYDSILSKEENTYIKEKLNARIKLLQCTNRGKMKAMLHFSDQFTTSHIKIIDHDDNIVWFSLRKFNRKVKKIDPDCFIWHKAAKVFKDSKIYGKQTTSFFKLVKQLKDSKDVRWLIPPNAQTLYNTKILQKISSVEFDRQRFFNDNFLTLSCQALTKETYYIKKHIPYIQFHRFGQTSVVNEQKGWSLVEFFKNLDTLNKNFEIDFSNSNWNKESSINWLDQQSNQFEEQKSYYFDNAKIYWDKLWK